MGELDGLPMTIKDAIAVEGVRSTGGAIELELVYADQSKETISVPVDERPLIPITAQNP